MWDSWGHYVYLSTEYIHIVPLEVSVWQRSFIFRKTTHSEEGRELQFFALQRNGREILHRPNTQEMLKLELGLDGLFVMWNLSWQYLGRDSKLHIFWHLQFYYACWYYVGPLVQHWLRGKSASDWITNAVSCSTRVKPWQQGRIITMWLLWLIFRCFYVHLRLVST